MIEIYRKGQKLDISPSQIVTFKKSQNLNGIQSRYAYSNTVSVDKTANNKKLLELFDLPTNKVSTLMNGFTVDVILNGSIQLKNQTLKIQKESLTKIDLYLLYSDNNLVIKLKQLYLNAVVADFKYKKNLDDLYSKRFGTLSKTALVETQEKSGLYVIEEMPILLNMQEVIRLVFLKLNYTVYGDFFRNDTTVKDYFIAPNKGVYQIYTGTGEGFSPTFDETLDAFTFLSNVLALINCYVEVDDTYKTVIINRWTNLGNYKNYYVDYSKYFVNYQDYSFESKLAKINEMTYSDSGTTFNSFFTNNLSSQDKETYLNSAFGTGTLNIFDDSEIQDDGTIPLRVNNSVGEISAVRIFKTNGSIVNTNIYDAGVAFPVSLPKAQSVSMRDIYTEFHKDYTDFILTPLIQNVVFRYDEILATTFSLTKVFFIEQLSSYWIPLEINFSTKKDQIIIKCMLVKKRKIESPILNNFNSILLDFKEKAVFPLSFLNSMYPIPPNVYLWDVVIFKRYDQDLNSLYINDVLIPENTLPQAFLIADIITLKIEANKPSDITPDLNTASLYIQAQDTNGGVSNEAYINIKHTGKATLQSDFTQTSEWNWLRLDFDKETKYLNLLTYILGPKPNINTTITSVTSPQDISVIPGNSFNLVEVTENYLATQVVISPFTIFLRTQNNRIGKARAIIQLIVDNGVSKFQVYEIGSANNQSKTITVPKQTVIFTSMPTGRKVKVYFKLSFDNVRGLNSGSMDAEVTISGMNVSIGTTKTV